MVKKFASGGNEKGKVRIKYFEVEVDGDSESLQESIRALTAAVSKSSSSVKYLPSGNSVRTPPALLEGNREPEIDEELENESVGEDEVVDSSPSKPIRQRAKRTPPTPKILENPGFDEGNPTWPEFAASKDPENDILRVAVVATWFKRSKSIDTITIDHAYTAYKFVDWPTPDDIGQAFRNAKRTKNWFGTDGAGNWTINIIGINAVDKLKKIEGAKS